jgi:hypothetical protein
VGASNSQATAKQENISYSFQMLSYNILSFGVGGGKKSAKLSDTFREVYLIVMRLGQIQRLKANGY